MDIPKDTKDTKCSTCMRVCAKTFKREDKTWCGGCKDGITYMSYPECFEYFDNSQKLFRKKPEYVPSQPPWTTWSGTLLCAQKSQLGQHILKTDPNAEDGYLVVDKKRVLVPGTVRGLYTA